MGDGEGIEEERSPLVKSRKDPLQCRGLWLRVLQKSIWLKYICHHPTQKLKTQIQNGITWEESKSDTRSSAEGTMLSAQEQRQRNQGLVTCSSFINVQCFLLY